MRPSVWVWVGGSLRVGHQECQLLPIGETGTGVALEAYVVFPALGPYWGLADISAEYQMELYF